LKENSTLFIKENGERGVPLTWFWNEENFLEYKTKIFGMEDVEGGGSIFLEQKMWNAVDLQNTRQAQT